MGTVECMTRLKWSFGCGLVSFWQPRSCRLYISPIVFATCYTGVMVNFLLGIACMTTNKTITSAAYKHDEEKLRSVIQVLFADWSITPKIPGVWFTHFREKFIKSNNIFCYRIASINSRSCAISKWFIFSFNNSLWLTLTLVASEKKLLTHL